MEWEKVYKKVAKANGVSVAEVKREIQAAIDAAYINPNFHAQCILRNGEIPTSEELMTHIARRALIISDG